MRRGSTPTHEIVLPDNIDVNLVDYAEITYSQEKAAKKIIVLRKTKDDYTIDGNVITSRGAGTAMDMALAITEYITGESQIKLSKAMIYG